LEKESFFYFELLVNAMLWEESESDLQSVSRVVRAVCDEEADGDHIRSIMLDFAGICHEYGGVVWPDEAEVTEEDVRITLRLLDEYEFDSLYEFVDLGARYTNRQLPEPRNWTVKYVHSDSVIETRNVEFADLYPKYPFIDGQPYKHEKTVEDGTTFNVHVVPDDGSGRRDYKISCDDCSLNETNIETRAEANHIKQTHSENNPNHTVRKRHH
jgi:hypothetical protein